MVAETDTGIVGACYTITGQELLRPGEKPAVLGYIYGFSVEPSYRSRGIGKALLESCCTLSRKRGAEIVCILPAEESLYPLYEKWMDARPVLYRNSQRVKAEQRELSMRMSSTEYMIWRENMLQGKTHVHLSNYALEYEKKMLECYGGGFFAVESAIAAAYVENGVGVIRELITADPRRTEDAAASVAYALGVEEAVLWLPGEKGLPYIAADRSIPQDCVWNLSYD